MATLRIKATWFNSGRPKTPAENASALAFVAWRVAVNAVKRLRDAGFEIDAGPAYFGVVREWLLFLLAGVDRMAYARLGPDGRAPFTAALVRRVAEILHDNEADLLPEQAGDSFHDRFIDQFNAVAGHYAEFAWSPDDGPDFGFTRYLGSRLEAQVPAQDRAWVLDQVQAVEVPEAVAMIRRAMDGVFSTAPRRERSHGMSGE
jgi:hypothetical protein